MRMRRSRGRSSRPARPMDWECAQLTVPNINSNDPGAIIGAYAVLPSTLRQFYTDPTLMATRFFGNAVLKNTGAIAVAQYIGVGVIAWDDKDDFVDDPPGPLSDCNLDWIARWVGAFPVGFIGPATANFNFTDLTHLSKSKRRLGNQKGLLVTFEALSIGVGTLSFGVAVDVRFLIKE